MKIQSEINDFPYRIHAPAFPDDGPAYSPPQPDWLRSKCKHLGIEFITTLIQPLTYIGHQLQSVAPLAELPIAKDGNCLFRAISAVLTGSQKRFKIRAEVCRYMAVQGASFISRYLESKFNPLTPTKYLLDFQMDVNMVWGTDIEIVVLSSILGVDIFVSNYHKSNEDSLSGSRWYRYHSTHDGFTTPAIYLSNYANHYEPVVDLIHTRTPTFFHTYSFSDAVVIE